MALSILLIRGLVEAVERAGIRREIFLARAKYDATKLNDAHARVSLAEYDRLVELAILATGDDALGLHAGEAADTTTYSLAAHLVVHATTLRHAISALVCYHKLLTDRRSHHLVEHGSTATIRFDLAPGSPVCRRFHAELTLVGLSRMVTFFGRGEGVRAVNFEHGEPAHRAEYARLFQGTERFGQPSSGVTFDGALLDTPQLHADADFHAALEIRARQRVSRISGQATYEERVLEYLVEHATAGRQEMSATARVLGVSVRTLRRRLEEEKVRYPDLVKSALATRAKHLISDHGRTIDETAYVLGFSERSAFHRAFKRWTGTTPNEYRRQLRDAASARGNGS